MASKIFRRSAAGTWVEVAELEDWQRINWNSAWGLIKRGTFKDQATVPKDYSPAIAIVDFASVTFQPVSGRRYRFTIQMRAVGNQDGVGPIAGNFNLYRNGVVIPVGVGGTDPWKRSNSQWTTWRLHLAYGSDVLGSDEATFTISYNNGTTTTTMWLNDPSIFYVEDLGPERA